MGEEIKKLMEMGAFFDMRSPTYDEVHSAMIGGGRESKDLIATYLPEHTKSLVDLGCGTGLELNAIFKRFPQIEVTGIDLSKGMLEKLKGKYAEHSIELVWGSYMDYDFGVGKFDAAISVMTMHHFNHEEKVSLYEKILACLKDNGVYIEGDYMVDTEQEEKHLFNEYDKIKKVQGIKEGYYHFDTPCTVMHQISFLKKAGFKKVTKVWHNDKNVILVAEK